MKKASNAPVVPAKAGTHHNLVLRRWIPAFAGMTSLALLASLALASDAAPPKKKKLSLQDLLSATVGKSSGRSATVAGVRGLDETGRTIDTQARDFAAVEALERVVIHEDELARFVSEGKLK